jgi:protein SCO1/2
MLRVSLAFLLAALVVSPAASQPTPGESRPLGRHIPDVEMTDDHGHVFRLGSLGGKPVLLSPIFTRCPHACIMITTSLRDALLAVGEPGIDYEVVTFTFDPDDTLDDLRDYRERHELPEGWRLARADSAELDSVLTAIGFSYTAEPGGFAHTNLVAVLTPDLETSGYLTGIAHDEDDVRRALLTAVAPASLVKKYRPLLIVVAGVAFLTVIVVLAATKRRGPKTGWSVL